MHSFLHWMEWKRNNKWQPRELMVDIPIIIVAVSLIAWGSYKLYTW